MPRLKLIHFLPSFIFLIFSTYLPAQDTTTTQVTLRVGVTGSAPFVYDDPANPNGIAIEIWEDLAEEQDWNYQYKSFDEVNAALTALTNEELDVVVGPISITSDRVARMRFSQPYYQSSISIASRADKPGLWQRIKPFFSFRLLIAVGVFLLILAIVGTLLWLAEHKASPDQFPQDPVRGIGNGMWLAIVTMSTTGYGDMAPITLRGRIIAGTWMVVTIIFATSMVAGIASTLTLSGMGSSTVKNAEELSGKKVATIKGSPSLTFLKGYKAKAIETSDIAEAFEMLKNHDVEAVVYDRPQLLYYVNEHPQEDLYIAKAEYYKQGYGFAFPLKDTLVYDVNRTLLKLAEERVVQDIVDEYIGEDK